jgi:hypothetical protein
VSNPSKDEGSRAERMVANYLTSLGIACERIPAGATADRGDLWVPLIEFPSIDVKDHAAMRLGEWVDRAAEQAHNAGRRGGIVWHKRRGFVDPGNWFVTTSGEMFLALMEIR